jgi:hypothetical protein
MKIRITQTLQRTVELEVDVTDEQAAIEAALVIASDTQAADWNYTWVPITQEGCVLGD